MSLNDFLEKQIIVTQTRSFSKLTKKQKASLVGLGLRGINSSRKLKCSKSILGMIEKTEHLVKVSPAS